MKWVLRVLSVLFILAGIVWILQGVNILGGSMMSGHIQYSLLGIVVGVIGGGMWYLINRRPRTL